ncbi:Elf1-domain-containing protein [Delitschia confertaspora ATCC 74209]|uniref:Transcription elongation factor 1 homolog n=1 Tax=Delitschia confertaspora ATCC 74209 TaxID=1513339 RepID=A0A9P4JYB7_9PLEO|nr:Elf1-domain-containing protein [Delitschia confertaspora ATCC 74209]
MPIADWLILSSPMRGLVTALRSRRPRRTVPRARTSSLYGLWGKRKKASKPVAAKKKEKLATTFLCLFCNHENSVAVTLEKKVGVGNLQCKVCGQTFQTRINALSAPVDVYCDWIDACDAVAKEAGRNVPQKTSSYRGTAAPNRPAAAAGEDETLGDDFIDDDDLDAEGEYADED